jgi:signal transduction histidine kinase
MVTRANKVFESFKKYHFEIRHLTVFLIVLILFQLVVSFVNKTSMQKFIVKTQEWYQQDSAERIANLTATSLELLLESNSQNQKLSKTDVRKTVQNLNIIFSQHLLHQNVQEICLLVSTDSSIAAIDDGLVLYDYAFSNLRDIPPPQMPHTDAIRLYKRLKDTIAATEQIHTILEGKQTFHIFVPFVPRGEYVGSVYMKNTPDFSIIAKEMISNYDEISATYAALIIFGLLAMFYVSSYTLKERNKTQQLLFEEQKRHLAEQINYENELMFTKRIYHTHHKAEKIMGFIKEDMRNLSSENIDIVKHRINQYSNFIARVIYDMKWYDPPLQTIRSTIFKTSVNEVIRFLVQNIFLRVSTTTEEYKFVLELDEKLPTVPINEFVLWEVLEPIIQNAIDHAGERQVKITIRTAFMPDSRRSRVTVQDNGKGIEPWLLEVGNEGVKKIFLEHSTTKKVSPQQRSGYGCYIAYEIATQRCGWNLDVENLAEGGCRFTITIPQG